MATKKLPDRTGMLILPASILVAAAWFSIALAWDAVELAGGSYERAQEVYERDQLISDMIGGLARTLGLVPSILVALVLTGAAGVWCFRTVKRYRAMTAEDRRLAGMG